MNSSFSAKARKFFDGVCTSIGRFPLTVSFAAVLAVVCIVLNHVSSDTVRQNVQFFLYWYPITAIMLSLGLSLLDEQRKCRVFTVIAHIIWAGVWVLMSRHEDVMYRQPCVLVFAALVALAAISVIVLPFFGRKEDLPMWNFTLTLIATVAVALLVALLLWGGLSLLLLSFEQLFGADISSNLYEDLAFASFFFVGPMLVLQGIPSAQNMHNTVPAQMPAFLRGAVRYLFIPLTLAYMATLYCYTAKIIITWNLPDGWVSYLVSASMLLVVLLQYAVRPYRDNRTYGTIAVRLVCGWMPKLMLPLLLLMSVGIVRRVSDYGITVSRVYLIVFNLWCYVACFIMWLKNDNRIMWLSMTPAMLFVLLSVFPVNVSSAVRNSMLRDVRRTIAQSGWNGTAMTDADYSAWLAGLDSDVAFRVDSRLDYLKSKYPHDCISDLISSDVLTGRAQKEKQEEVERTYLSSFRQVLEWAEIPVPKGMTRTMMYDYRSNVGEIEMADSSVTASFPIDVNGNTCFKISVPTADLRALADDYGKDIMSQKQHILQYSGVLTDGRPCVFILNHFSLRLEHGNESMDVSGLLFY